MKNDTVGWKRVVEARQLDAHDKHRKLEVMAREKAYAFADEL
jgi:hypothetical protein